MAPTNLLIDADILVHRFAHSGLRTFDWGEGDVVDLDYAAATSDMRRFINNMMDTLGAKSFIMCLSCPSGTGFREEILPCYKGGRGEKPEFYQQMRDHIVADYHCRKVPRLEADDLLGIYSTREPGKHIICTIDKDLDQIPGAHYNWTYRQRYEISEEAGTRWFYQQILEGDRCDNYKGIPGIGPVKAGKILDAAEPGKEWEAIVEAHEAAGLPESYAIVTAQVARMLRDGDLDPKTQAPILWQPPQSSDP